jgi:hypothetical protein
MAGLGFMGLGFYVFFFAFVDMDYLLLGNYVLLFCILTSLLGCVVVYFLFMAFSFSTHEMRYRLDERQAGLVAGSLLMVAIILMLLSFRAEGLGLMDDLSLIEAVHPAVAFFLAAVCMALFLWPEERRDRIGNETVWK